VLAKKPPTNSSPTNPSTHSASSPPEASEDSPAEHSTNSPASSPPPQPNSTHHNSHHNHRTQAADSPLFSTSAPISNADLVASGGGLPRTLDTVHDYATRGGVGIDGVRIQLLEAGDDIRYLDANGASAFASDNTIFLGPAAFVDEETLIRTLGHERTHIWQQTIWQSGSGRVNAQLEDAAYATEDSFVQYFRNGGAE
jgi:hypothetical protein